MAKAIDKAVQDREALGDTIDYLELELEKNSIYPLTATEVSYLLSESKDAQDTLVDIHTRIRHHEKDAEEHVKVYLSLRSKIMKLICKLTGLKMSLEKESESVHTPVSTSSPKSDFKLPRLDLPLFSGELQDWVSFRDMFANAIHDNPNLSKCQKFTYLKSKLQGEALRSIQSMIITDDNYDTAWQQLANRYHNERELLFTIMKKLFNQNSISEASSKSIRQLIDNTRECIRSLDVLNCPTKEWDSLLLYVVFTKLDSSSKQQWEQQLTDSKIPPLQNLVDFLEIRARSLAASGETKTPMQKTNDKHVKLPMARPTARNHHTQTYKQCVVCKSNNHYISKCPEFINMESNIRIDIAKKHKLCSNCLRPGHAVAKCASTFRCKTCNENHHTMLHVTANQTSSQTSAFYANVEVKSLMQPVLATAVIKVANNFSITQRCRAFLDNGATQNYITEATAKRLGLPRSKHNVHISGLGDSHLGTTKWITHFKIKPHFESQIEISTSALIVPSITGKLPPNTLDPNQWKHINNLSLADPQWYKPSSIEILLGAEIFFDVIPNGKLSSNCGGPTAINSSLGWLIGGGSSPVTSTQIFHSTSFEASDERTDRVLERFWNLESIPSKRFHTPEEKFALDHFHETYKRDLDGRFVVKLPFKESPTSLGSSQEIAIRRLKSMERRLNSKPEFYEEYKKFMNEYLHLGHMIEVQPPCSKLKVSYIPHQFVLKEESTTTKFRVVFDASAHTSNGVALNDIMAVGPTVQESLFNIIVRFRLHLIAFVGDVAKIYRQIQVDSSDADLQRIVWRSHPNEDIRHYKLQTVTYGTASAPFLATECLNELGRQNRNRFPEAATCILRDFYVDDMMTGASSVMAAVKIYQQITHVLSSGCFTLRKFTSNSEEFLKYIPEELRERPFGNELTCIKALGIKWNPRTDNFVFSWPYNKLRNPTKRSVLSAISKIFDPIGWLSPVTVRSKILMQQIWLSGASWDSALSNSLQQKWESINNDLENLQKIEIPRCVLKADYDVNDVDVCLVGCCDASEIAYAAAIYIAFYKDGNFVSSHLISSKTRVSPCKKISVPRLELCSALLCAELLHTITEALQIKIHSVTCWTDSTDALAWIRGHPSRWATFVANRVNKIQEIISSEKWGHIPGVKNPADCASRGISTNELADHALWWKGPKFLENGIPTCEIKELHASPAVKLEMKSKVFSLNNHIESQSLIMRFSTLTRLQRVLAFMLRFVSNSRAKCKKDHDARTIGPLQPTELKGAMLILVKMTQRSFFGLEIQAMKSSEKKFKCSFINLSPFLDSEGAIRVGGRLKESKLTENQKHPFLLPRQAYLTKLLVNHAHLACGHGSHQLVINYLHQTFWILRCRDVVRAEIHKCITCTKLKAKMMTQAMADLPNFRVISARPFQKVGVDFAGPLMIRSIQPRSKVTLKGYICIFICAATRAIHIEIVSSLSTQAFIACLKRFVSRRGLPSDIYSDCGTNFRGAAKEMDLQKMMQSKTFNQEIADHLSTQGTHWHFNPPASPHFGGLWEAGVKSIKYHLRRIIGIERLSFEELNTCCCQIQSILNSRPMTPMSTDPNDLHALTPGHFLIGQPMIAAPEENLQDIQMNKLGRWQLLQRFVQTFWRRWSAEYLSRLQAKPKWYHPNRNISIGDLVIIKEENLPPQQWRLGRVAVIHPGKDGNIRVVDLTTSSGMLRRPIVKLCHLPMDNDDRVEVNTSKGAEC